MIRLLKADVLVDTSYRKTLRLGKSEEDVNCVYINLNELDEDYESYIQDVLRYFRGEINLGEVLGVDRVVPKGYYIMGIFGGEKKRGKESYAGLVFDVIGRDPVKDVHIIRLHNVSTNLIVPTSELMNYWFKLIYVGAVHPFYLEKVYDILLSKSGKNDLITFLQKITQLNRSKLSSTEVEMINKLIEEVQQPNNITPLSKEKYYVVFRCDRTFSSLVLNQSQRFIVESHLSFLETPSKDLALYYSAVLNYLVYRTIKAKLAFVRHQFERPLYVIAEAGLSWKDVSEDMREAVAKLSEQLHEEAKVMFKGQSFSQERQYFKVLEKNPKFNKLVKMLDDYVSNTIGLDELIEILSHWVAGRS